MAKKYYAVKAGRQPGIYFTWSDCERQVKGFGGAIYKSFSTKEEAEQFVGAMSVADYFSSNASQTPARDYQSQKGVVAKSATTTMKFESVGSKQPNFNEPNHLIAYIDGSFDKRRGSVGAGGIMFINGEQKTFSFGNTDPKYSAFWNVSGELLAAMYVMNYALEHNIPQCSLYYDYMGIEMWATKRWKRNNIVTEEYATFCETIFTSVKVNFHKVAAHTGDTYNEMADKLAKAGAAQ